LVKYMCFWLYMGKIWWVSCGMCSSLRL